MFLVPSFLLFFFFFFFFNDTATTEIYTLSLHDALPVSGALLGTTLGAGLGAALASVITVQQAGVATIVLPARQLLVDLALASTAGLLAAAVPARRAARLNLLTAINAE